VRAWINIGGILHGTPIADKYLSWLKSWLASLLILFKGGNDWHGTYHFIKDQIQEIEIFRIVDKQTRAMIEIDDNS
jgi:hypothetical protein